MAIFLASLLTAIAFKIAWLLPIGHVEQWLTAFNVSAAAAISAVLWSFTAHRDLLKNCATMTLGAGVPAALLIFAFIQL